jgi:TonB family protein
MWLCYRRFRADQELACDADVLATQRTDRTPDESASIYAKALLKSVTKPSSNRGRGSISLRPCSTHYGYKQGSFTMMKERFNNLNKRHHTRRLPTYICSILACSFATLWQLPAYSQAETTNSAAETKPLMPIVRIEPRYPEQAANNGIEGYVDLSFVITNDGKTQDITVIDSKPAGVFDEVVVAAVERWRYQPQDNKRNKIRVQMTMGNEQ